MTELKSISFRLRPQTHERLRQMAEVSNRSMVGALEGAVDAAWQTIYLPAIKEAEQLAERGRELVRVIEERLGPAFWRDDGVHELGFEPTPEGRVVLHAGKARYTTDAEGGIFKVYSRGGRAEFAAITEDGLGDVQAVPLVSPAMN